MKRYSKTIIWSVVILVLLLLPGEKIPRHRLFEIPHLDKLSHLFLFTILYFLALFEGAIFPRLSRKAIILFSLCSIFAIFSELLQFLPFVDRDPNVYDFLADLAGLLFGGILLRIAYRFKYLSYHPQN